MSAETYGTYGYLANDGVTVYAVFHVNATGTVSWEHSADTRADCKVCGKSESARARVGAARSAKRLAPAATVSTESSARATKTDAPRVLVDATDARTALVDAMRESMAEETSEESEAFRSRLAASIKDTDEK